MNSQIKSITINVAGYTLCQSDRTYRKGGDVAIYVDSDIVFCHIKRNKLKEGCTEYITMELLSSNIILICIYLPPSLSMVLLENSHDESIRVCDFSYAKSESQSHDAWRRLINSIQCGFM